MRKTTKTTAKGKTAKTATTARRTTAKRSDPTAPEVQAARVARWRKYIADKVAAVQSCAVYASAYLPLDIIEEIEGAPVVDVLLRRLCELRGIGTDSFNGSQYLNRTRDDDFEKASPQSRKSHEKTLCDSFADFELANCSPLVGEDLRRFVRRWYLKGDVTLRPAIARALVASLAL